MKCKKNILKGLWINKIFKVHRLKTFLISVKSFLSNFVLFLTEPDIFTWIQTKHGEKETEPSSDEEEAEVILTRFDI